MLLDLFLPEDHPRQPVLVFSHSQLYGTFCGVLFVHGLLFDSSIDQLLAIPAELCSSLDELIDLTLYTDEANSVYNTVFVYKLIVAWAPSMPT